MPEAQRAGAELLAEEERFLGLATPRSGSGGEAGAGAVLRRG
jgi:hypothetical protein